MREVEVLIIGAGVTGLTAAAEAAQLGLRVLVVERLGAGGQVLTVERIDNMPGFEPGTAGYEIGPDLQDRAENAGAEFMLGEVKSLLRDADRYVVQTDGEPVAARAVLVAAGSRRRSLGVPGEEEWQGQGVSQCASCDGPLFRGQHVVVVGGGDSACGEAALLAAHAKRVSLVFPGEKPHAISSLVEQAARMANIEWIPGVRVEAITGYKRVTGVLLRDSTGLRELPADGVFVYAGLQADTAFVAKLLQLDEDGRIKTDASRCSSLPGVYAAGDVRAGASYLLADAAADGAAAARSIHGYLLQRSH